MKMKRRKLLGYLEGIYAGGLIPQVVLSEDLSASSVSEDQSLLVDAGSPVEGDDLLEEPVGIMDLGRLIGTLRLSTAEEVVVGVRDRRLVLTLGNSTAALVTAAPGNVVGRVNGEDMDEIRESAAAKGEGEGLDPEAVDEILKALSLLRPPSGAEAVVTFLLREDQCGVRIGAGTEDQVLVKLPETGHSKTEERVVAADALEAVLKLTGVDAVAWFTEIGTVRIRNGRHEYYLAALASEE